MAIGHMLLDFKTVLKNTALFNSDNRKALRKKNNIQNIKIQANDVMAFYKKTLNVIVDYI